MTSQLPNKTPVQNVVVTSDDADRRLDNFLSARLKRVPKAMIHRIIRTGQVRINGKRANAAARLQCGDGVRIPPVYLDHVSSPTPPASVILNFDELVRYEDSQVLVVDKPAGLAAHGGTGIRLSLIDIARAARPGIEHLDLVHRIDRATSGCLLLAKDPITLRRLNQQLADRGFFKEYITLLQGRLTPTRQVIDIALNSDYRDAVERKTEAHPDGKAARTTFEVMQQFEHCCVVSGTIETGRTHQIRAHARHLGHPVAGDLKYGDPVFNDYTRQLGLRRLFLHASRIEFDLAHRIVVEAELPPELRALLGKLATRPT